MDPRNRARNTSHVSSEPPQRRTHSLGGCVITVFQRVKKTSKFTSLALTSEVGFPSPATRAQNPNPELLPEDGGNFRE